MFANLFARKKVARSYNHSPQFVAAWQKLPDSIGEEYAAGASLFDLGVKYDCNPQSIRKKLAALNVSTKRPRVLGFRNGPLKLTLEQVKWILEQDLQNVPHTDIASKVNISRERVRQICAANNHPTRASRRTKMVELRERREANRLSRQRSIEELSELWKSGATFATLTEYLGYKSHQQSASKIAGYRKEHPDLFPYRNSLQARMKHLTAMEAEERSIAIAQAWNDKVPAVVIAEKFGFKNAQSLHAFISKFRYRKPELFQARKRVPSGFSGTVDERRKIISEMWIRGDKMQDIARVVGYTDFKSCYNFMFAQRKLFPEMFPPRP